MNCALCSGAVICGPCARRVFRDDDARDAIDEVAPRLVAVVEKLRRAYQASGHPGVALVDTTALAEAIDEVAQLATIALLSSETKRGQK